MQNRIVLLILLLATSSALGQSGSIVVCSVSGARNVNEIRTEGRALTMEVNGYPIIYDIERTSASNLQNVSSLVGEPVIESHQYVISAPQGSELLAPTDSNIIELATTSAGAAFMLVPEEGVIASSQACE